MEIPENRFEKDTISASDSGSDSIFGKRQAVSALDPARGNPKPKTSDEGSVPKMSHETILSPLAPGTSNKSSKFSGQVDGGDRTVAGDSYDNQYQEPPRHGISSIQKMKARLEALSSENADVRKGAEMPTRTAKYKYNDVGLAAKKQFGDEVYFLLSTENFKKYNDTLLFIGEKPRDITTALEDIFTLFSDAGLQDLGSSFIKFFPQHYHSSYAERRG